MNNCLKSILPILALTVLLAGSASAETKIATIDLRKVFDNYWKTLRATDALKERAAELDKDHKKMLEEYNKARTEYQKIQTSANDPAIAPEEKEKRKQAAETKSADIKEMEVQITGFERQARSNLDTQRQRMREDVLKEIRTAIGDKARSAGYSLVLDTAAESFNNTPVIMFTNGENDITETILAQMNSTAPAGLPKSAEPKDEPKEEKKK